MTDAGSNTRAATSPRRSTGVFDLDPVSDEERGDLSPHTRRWLTQDDLAREAHRTEHRDHGRDLHSLRREPRVAIGQWSFLVRTSRGNVLWDPPVHLDAEVEGLVRDLGGVAVIATSHPHLFAARIGWSHALDRAPVLVNAHGAESVPHPDPVIDYWIDEVEPLPGFRMIRLGGHLSSSAVAVTAGGDLLAGDSNSGSLDPHWVLFQRNFPRPVPLSAAVVQRLVEQTARRHIRWVSGEFDHLT